MDMPADNFILLSVINTALRDKYSSYAEFCVEEGVDGEEAERRLNSIGYFYDEKGNAFR